jgi:uncharacterized protein (DUF697 family)
MNTLRNRAAGWIWRRWQSRAARPGASTLEPNPWVEVPASTHQIADVVRECRRLIHRRSMVAAGVAMVPVPGLDLVTDVATLGKLIGEINTAFGLTPEQIERLAPDRRLVVYKAISAGGGLLVGRLVTRELVMRLLKLVGVRLTAQQAAKWVPIAGQAVSAALTYSSLKFVCDQHIRQCVEVSKQLLLTAPAAQTSVEEKR